MNTRIQGVQAKIKELDLDAFLVTSPENRRYLTGFTGTSGWVLITQNDAYFFTDFRYIEQAKKQVKDCHLIKWDQFNPYLSLRQQMGELDLYTFGVESGHLTVADFLELKNQFGTKAVQPQRNVVETLRMVKSQEEIDLIAYAESIGDKAFAHVLPLIKPGVSELEIAMELEFFMRKNGADGLSFTSIVASGARSAMPHGVASEKKIEVGDFVTMDFGCVYQGYCSDMTRTVGVGKVDEEQEKVYNLVLKAQQTALDGIKAGVIGKDIDELCRQVYRQANVLSYFGHGLGHSLGLEVHEEPRFSIKDNNVMQENMVLSVEPGLYFPNWGGVRIEDIVVIKKDGCENLTHSPKELIIV